MTLNKLFFYYYPSKLTVRLLDETDVKCRSYQKLGVGDSQDSKKPVTESLPSQAYVTGRSTFETYINDFNLVIIDGAVENNLPKKYIKKTSQN